MEKPLTGAEFLKLFPSYLWLDVEASSLSVDSWPIEIGWCSADLKAHSFLVKPMDQWTDWSRASETIHGISRAELDMHGVEAVETARRLNEIARGKQVLSDNPEADSDWLRQLYHDTGVDQTFAIQDARKLEALAITLGRLTTGYAQSLTEDINRAFPHPHRAGPDARREAARFLALSLPEKMEDILALA